MLTTGVGDRQEQLGGEGSLQKTLLHAGIGCTAASAKGGDCASGAFGGVAGETFAGIYGKEIGQKANTALSRISTVFAASAAGHDINDADATASNSIKNNCWDHPESCFGDYGFADTMRGLLTGEYFGGDADGPATDKQITEKIIEDINQPRKDLGKAIFKLNPSVDSPFENETVDHYFDGEGTDFYMSQKDYEIFKSTGYDGHDPYFDQSLGDINPKTKIKLDNDHAK